jgi:hypothetical protein
MIAITRSKVGLDAQGFAKYALRIDAEASFWELLSNLDCKASL